MSMIFKYRRTILLLVALGNIFGAIIAIAFPAWFMEQFFKVPPQAAGTFPYLPMYHYTFWIFVLIMGVGYWMTAITPDKNKAVLFIGGAGKISAAIFWVMLFAQGFGNWFMITGGIYDGLLGIVLLVLFLLSPSKESV